MLKPRPNSVTLLLTLFLATFLIGCGDSSPDLEVAPTFDDSPLRVSIPIDEVKFQWFPVFTDEEDPADRRVSTEYRLTQIDQEGELIPGRVLLITDSLEADIDVSALTAQEFAARFGSLDLINAGFRLEANHPDDGWIDISYLVAFFRAGQVIQFDWDEVAGATQYRLTQTNGSYPLFEGAEPAVIYPADVRSGRFALSVPLFEWLGSRFTLEAFVDGEWLLIGQQDTAGGSYNLIRSYTETDAYANVLGSQLAYGFDLSLSEDGKTMAVGAIGETSVPLAQRECPEDDTECDPETSVFALRNSGGVFVYDLESNEKILVKSPAVDGDDVFGRAVALSDDGQILAVAAVGEDSDVAGVQTALDPLLDNANAADSGAAYVYVRNADDWALEAYIKAPVIDATPEGELGDLFGWALALSGDGNTLAISSVNEDGDGTGPANNDQSNAGAVFVYRRTAAGVWAQEAYLKASNAESDDTFGHALTMSADGSYLAVSALGESGFSGDPDSNGKNRSGAVYVFARDLTGEWSQTSYLKASNADAVDSFGQSISFDAGANILAVGAPGEDQAAAGVTAVNSGDGSGNGNFGAAYLFERTGSGIASTWQQKNFYFKASNPFPVAGFGQSVVVSSGGDYLAVGAWGDSSNSVGLNGGQNAHSLPGSGAAYIFERQLDNDSWRQVAFVKAPILTQFLYFGSAIDMSLNGEILGVAGVSLGSEGVVTGRSGNVYLY